MDRQHNPKVRSRRSATSRALTPPADLRHDPSLHAPPPRDGRSTTANKASSTTSEFVRRKNWAQRIIEEIQDFLHVLSPTGDILFASPSIADLSGWTADELLSQPMRDFLHPTDAATYAREFARSIRDNVPITLYCRVRRKPTDGQVGDRFTVFEMAGRPYTGPAAYAALAAAGVDGYTDDSLMAVDENVHDLSAAGGGLGGSGAAAPVDPTRTAQVFLATGRPYPSKNAEMLDSFLDIKVENERLRAELNQLYAEIEASDDLKPSSSTSATSGGLTNALGQATLASPRTMHHPTMLELPPPPAPPTLHGVGALGIGVKPPPGEGSDRKRKAKVRDDADGGTPMLCVASSDPSRLRLSRLRVY